MATHSMLSDWLLAMKLAEKLYDRSRWSKALYLYLKASYMLEIVAEQQRQPGGTPDMEMIKAMQAKVSEMMHEIPALRQRIAGKSVPIEKFAAAKAIRYAKTGYICLPGVEMILLLNWTRIINADKVSAFVSSLEMLFYYCIQ